MGITLHVESIITPLSRRTPGPHMRFVIQQQRINRICEVFQWDQPPWDEPSEAEGLDTSANYTRWAPVLHLAHILSVLFSWEEEMISLSNAVSAGIAHEIETSGTATHQARSRVFPHLRWHHENTAYWLPYEFESPKFLTTPGFAEDIYNFSIGSSVYLRREMQTICRVCDAIALLRGAEREVGTHKWEGIQDLCHVVLEGAEESLTLQLPFMIFW